MTLIRAVAGEHRSEQHGGGNLPKQQVDDVMCEGRGRHEAARANVVKTFTASDTSSHDGFFVLGCAAEDCFPLQVPSQELVAKDMHTARSGSSAISIEANHEGIF
ncbi:unnamed protein product [Urochloa humidicola]